MAPFDGKDFALSVAFAPSGSPAEAPTVNPIDSDEVLRDLIAGRARIDAPHKWCQNVKRDGIRWCSWGALVHWECAAEEYLNRAARELDPKLMSAFCASFMDFNDAHPHTTVMTMWDRAISARRAELEA